MPTDSGYRTDICRSYNTLKTLRKWRIHSCLSVPLSGGKFLFIINMIPVADRRIQHRTTYTPLRIREGCAGAIVTVEGH